jgi:hypothetical protein
VDVVSDKFQAWGNRLIPLKLQRYPSSREKPISFVTSQGLRSPAIWISKL